MGLDPLTLKDLKCLGIARLLQRTAWIALAISSPGAGSLRLSVSVTPLFVSCPLLPLCLLPAEFESDGQYRWWPVSARRVWTAWCPAALTAKSFEAPGRRSSASVPGSSPSPHSLLPGVLCRRSRRSGALWPGGAPDDDRLDSGWSSGWILDCHPPLLWSNYRCPFGASVFQPSGCTY